MKTVKLFISFTETLYEMANGHIKQQDLDTGLFCFGCAMCHLMNPWTFRGLVKDCEVDWAFKNKRAGKRAHKQLVSAITKAESEGKVKWRNESVGNTTFVGLNELLKQNGIKPLPKHYEYECYNYPAVKHAFKSSKRPVEIVFREQYKSK